MVWKPDTFFRLYVSPLKQKPQTMVLFNSYIHFVEMKNGVEFTATWKQTTTWDCFQMVTSFIARGTTLKNSTGDAFSCNEEFICFRITLKTTCAMNLRLFPFDTQTCRIQIASCKFSIFILVYQSLTNVQIKREMAGSLHYKIQTKDRNKWEIAKD